MVNSRKTTPRGVKVSPQSKVNIQKLANAIRIKVFNQRENACLNLTHQLEFTLPNLGLEWEIVPVSEMPDTEAATSPDLAKMKIREDIYDALHDTNSPLHQRARFTIAHEIGHLFMHDGVSLARHNSSSHQHYEDSEWQADAFAAELLMPSDECIGLSAHQIQTKYDVSYTAALAKFNALNK